MKRFQCACGNRIFFENAICLGCGRPVGFVPEELTMSPLQPVGSNIFETSTSRRVRRCRNTADYGNCNWVIPWDDPEELCISCRSNRTIPRLDQGDNLVLWSKIEHAKRRLLYTLLELGLLAPAGDRDAWPTFQILEDQRRNPSVVEDFVATGHRGGLITLNLAEADAISRQTEREQFFERYRTVLGHLRHEAGHHFFPRLTRETADLEACRAVFGDEQQPYDEALARHYETGPPKDWPRRYVSAYASVHPREDFAESFAHVLLIHDGLETADAEGLGDIGAGLPRINRWMEIAVTLNELSRSLGADDAYPFTLTLPVIQKLQLIEQLVRRR